MASGAFSNSSCPRSTTIDEDREQIRIWSQRARQAYDSVLKRLKRTESLLHIKNRQNETLSQQLQDAQSSNEQAQSQNLLLINKIDRLESELTEQRSTTGREHELIITNQHLRNLASTYMDELRAMREENALRQACNDEVFCDGSDIDEPYRESYQKLAHQANSQHNWLIRNGGHEIMNAENILQKPSSGKLTVASSVPLPLQDTHKNATNSYWNKPSASVPPSTQLFNVNGCHSQLRGQRVDIDCNSLPIPIHYSQHGQNDGTTLEIHHNHHMSNGYPSDSLQLSPHTIALANQTVANQVQNNPAMQSSGYGVLSSSVGAPPNLGDNRSLGILSRGDEYFQVLPYEWNHHLENDIYPQRNLSHSVPTGPYLQDQHFQSPNQRLSVSSTQPLYPLDQTLNLHAPNLQSHKSVNMTNTQYPEQIYLNCPL